MAEFDCRSAPTDSFSDMHDDVTTWLRGRHIELAEWRQPCNNSVHLANHVDQSTKVIIHGCESVEGLQCVDR